METAWIYVVPVLVVFIFDTPYRLESQLRTSLEAIYDSFIVRYIPLQL